MSVSLYRKYRPQNFASVVGQKSAIEVLTNSITKNRVGHAYLFSGSRGCGKTSVARIFAKALNCLNRQNFEPCGECQNCKEITSGESLDVIEIDGASNNGVENIRGLKENVNLAAFNSHYKIYIIDEVHMLSTGAFNALLKTLEEPPEHVIFIMATTEPHKVPVTIRSRCQHIPFHSIKAEDIFTRLTEICSLENVNAEPEALREISRLADGALRDALSLLEQIISAGNVNLSNVEKIFGAGSRPAFERWVKALREDPAEAYSSLKAMFDAGASGVRVFEELFSLVKNLWLVSTWKNNILDSLNLSQAEKNFLLDEVKFWKSERLHAILHIILKLLTQARLGIKNDILLGMLMLYLAGDAPKLDDVQPITQTRLIIPETKKPESDLPEIKPEKNSLMPNIELKEKLLNAAKEKNIVIYCGLFDADFYEQNGTLTLDFKTLFCFDLMRIDRKAATIKSIFSDYGRIVLRHNESEFVCPTFPSQREKNQPANSAYNAPDTLTARTPNSDALKPGTPNSDALKPGTPNSDARTPDSFMPGMPRADVHRQEQREPPSPFSALIHELTRLGMKPEKLFTRKTEIQDEGQDDIDIPEQEEGEN